MISLYVKNYCRNCPEFEVNVEKDALCVDNSLAEGATIITRTNIYCKHKDRCASMIKFLEERRKNND